MHLRTSLAALSLTLASVSSVLALEEEAAQTASAQPVAAAASANAEGEGSGYAVRTLSGEVHRARSLTRVGEQFHLTNEAGEQVVLDRGTIDFYQTFRDNLGADGGNVVWFRSGSYLRFESLELERGQAIIQLGEDRKVTLAEQLIDFQATVLESGMVVLPAGAGGAMIQARSRGVEKASSSSKRRSRRDRSGDDSRSSSRVPSRRSRGKKAETSQTKEGG